MSSRRTAQSLGHPAWVGKRLSRSAGSSQPGSLASALEAARTPAAHAHVPEWVAHVNHATGHILPVGMAHGYLCSDDVCFSSHSVAAFTLLHINTFSSYTFKEYVQVKHLSRGRQKGPYPWRSQEEHLAIDRVLTLRAPQLRESCIALKDDDGGRYRLSVQGGLPLWRRQRLAR